MIKKINNKRNVKKQNIKYIFWNFLHVSYKCIFDIGKQIIVFIIFLEVIITNTKNFNVYNKLKYFKS